MVARLRNCPLWRESAPVFLLYQLGSVETLSVASTSLNHAPVGDVVSCLGTISNRTLRLGPISTTTEIGQAYINFAATWVRERVEHHGVAVHNRTQTSICTAIARSRYSCRLDLWGRDFSLVLVFELLVSFAPLLALFCSDLGSTLPTPLQHLQILVFVYGCCLVSTAASSHRVRVCFVPLDLFW